MPQKLSAQPISTSVLPSETRKLNLDTLPFGAHEQYLDRLYRQYNIRVNHALLFYVEDETAPVIFVDKSEVNIGRQDRRGRITPEFDLSVYDGADRGVSRLHAQIIWDGKNYLLQDLHSTNHTWLNGVKVVPYQYTPLTDGSIIQFGSLMMTAFVIRR